MLESNEPRGEKSTLRRVGRVLGEVFVVVIAVSRERFTEKGQGGKDGREVRE